MIFCLVLDNGLKSLKTCQSSSTFTLLDMYKTAAESFCKIKPHSSPASPSLVSSSENRFIIFTTASTTECKIRTTCETPLDQVLEQIKTIQSEGWSDWDETFRQMNEYLVVRRLATSADTLGQGTFMSTVCNTCIIVFSEGIPVFLGEQWRREKLKFLPQQPHSIVPSESLTPFLGYSFDRSDFGMHVFVPFCTEISALGLQTESFKKHLGIAESRFHIHSFTDQIGCMKILEQLSAATSFLVGNFFVEREESSGASAAFAKATIIPTDLRHGYWCFPEPSSYQKKLEMHPKSLAPRPSFLGLWIKKSKDADVAVQVPPKFPVDEYIVYPDSAEEFLQLLQIQDLPSQYGSIYFDIFSSADEEAKPFGQMKICSSTGAAGIVVQLTLLPWDFRGLFEIIASLHSSSPTVFGDRLYRFIGEQVPKNYIVTLKNALKYIGISTKFPKSLNEGYIPQLLQARNQLSQSASCHLKSMHEVIGKRMVKPATKPISISQMLSQESLKAVDKNAKAFDPKTFLQISSIFFQMGKVALKALEEQHEKVNLPVSKMGDFHKDLTESLKFRNPYQDDHEQSVLSSNLFSSPFRRRRSLSSENSLSSGKIPNAKRAIMDLVDVGEDDEFSDALLGEPRSFVEEPLLPSENESQNSHFAVEVKAPALAVAPIEELIRIVRNPGDSIAKCAELLLDKSLTSSMKELLCQEALRWKKHRLIDYIQKH